MVVWLLPSATVVSIIVTITHVLSQRGQSMSIKVAITLKVIAGPPATPSIHLLNADFGSAIVSFEKALTNSFIPIESYRVAFFLLLILLLLLLILLFVVAVARCRCKSSFTTFHLAS